MASSIDVTFPADGVKVSKATLRAQWLVIKNEIEALQSKISVAGRIAYDDTPDRTEIENMVRSLNDRDDRLAYQIAVGVVSL